MTTVYVLSLAQTEVTIEDLNKARDAYVQDERDKAIADPNPGTMTVTMSFNGNEMASGSFF